MTLTGSWRRLSRTSFVREGQHLTETNVETPADTGSDQPTPNPSLRDVIERAAFTAVQALLATWITVGSVSISAREIILLTALATVLTALRAWVAQWLGGNKEGPATWVEDLLSRGAFTFATTFVAALITAARTPLTMSAVHSAALAGLAAVLAAVKAAAARGIGDPRSASILSTA